MEKILFIGAGNMGEALMASIFQKYSLFAIDPNLERRAFLEKNYSIPSFPNANSFQNWEELDMVFLSIKPQQLKEAVSHLKINLQKTVFISIVAGATLNNLSQILKSNKIIRAMPNTPALLKSAMTGLFSLPHLKKEEKQWAEDIFNSVGFSFWVEKESDMDSVTALSGSGPAYVFYFLECFEKAALKLGFSKELSKQMALKTLMGAGELAKTDDFFNLRQKVTSKGGTTEAGIAVLKEEHFEEIFFKAIQAAKEKSFQLSQL